MPYIAKNSGLTTPVGKEVVELLVRAKLRPGLAIPLCELSGFLEEHHAIMLGGHMQLEDKEVAVITFYVDVREATLPAEKLFEELRQQRFILSAEAKSTAEVFFENFYFPATSGGHFRIFSLAADSWMGLVEELFKVYGSGGASILYTSGRAIGGRIIQKMKERRIEKQWTRELLRANLEAMFRAYGMGMLTVRAIGASGFSVKILDPLMAERAGRFTDHFSIGVVAGSLEAIHDKEIEIREIKYDSAKRLLTFKCLRR